MATSILQDKAAKEARKDTPESGVPRPVRSASKRFVRNLVWVAIICALFMTGQLLRYGFNLSQLDLIQKETDRLYTSVLGPDIGSSPFGRLQFEQGKLAATLRIGLDPLSVLAALSKNAPVSLRVEEVVLDGKRGTIHGFFGPSVDEFDGYIQQLSDNDNYFFSLNKREEVFGGINFSLIVEPK